MNVVLFFFYTLKFHFSKNRKWAGGCSFHIVPATFNVIQTHFTRALYWQFEIGNQGSFFLCLCYADFDSEYLYVMEFGTELMKIMYVHGNQTTRVYFLVAPPVGE